MYEFLDYQTQDVMTREPVTIAPGARLREARIATSRCAVWVPPHWAMSMSVDVPDVPGEEREGYLALRAERISAD